MNKIWSPMIASIVVITFGMIFHFYNVSPNNWAAVLMWLPLYISPIWGAFGLEYLSGGKKNGSD